MGKRLTDCITSQYIGAANRLGSKSARRRIVAYVESYDDIFFWRSILTRFENEERYFEVLLPSRLEHLERGKKAAIMSMIAAGGVGRNMIACVDADYDYVAQGATYSSKTILDNPYIFHSYAYAIENMQCYAPSLHNVCVAVTLNDAQKFDFEAFLADFSTAIFPLFVWSVWSYRNAAERRFTISDFIRSIELGTLSPENASAAIAQLRRRVAHKVKMLQSQHSGAKESYLNVKNSLRELGILPSETYMYIQGHHLFDKVVVPLVKKVCNTLVRERERDISRQSVHATQQRNDLSCYSSSVGSVEYSLRRNVGYVASEQYRRIVSDLERFFNNTSDTTTSPQNHNISPTNHTTSPSHHNTTFNEYSLTTNT